MVFAPVRIRLEEFGDPRRHAKTCGAEYVEFTARGHQQLGHFDVLRKQRGMQRGPTKAVMHVHIRAVRREQLDDRPAAHPGSAVQWGRTARVARVDISALVDQQHRDAGTIGLGGPMQRRPTETIVAVDVRVSRDQGFQQIHLPHRGRFMQRAHPNQSSLSPFYRYGRRNANSRGCAPS